MKSFKVNLQHLYQLLESKDHLIDKLDLTDDQKEQLKAFFKKHPNFENKIDWNNKGLQWADFQDLIAIEGKTKTQAKKKGLEGLTEGKDYEIIDQGQSDMGPWIIYYPLNHKASQTLASTKTVPVIEGKWCIAMNDSHYWFDYTRRAIDFFFVFFFPEIGNTGAKFAISRQPLDQSFEFEVFSSMDSNLGNNDLAETVIDLSDDPKHWAFQALGNRDGFSYRKALTKVLKDTFNTLWNYPNKILATNVDQALKLKRENKWLLDNGYIDVDKILYYQGLVSNLPDKEYPFDNFKIDLTLPANYPEKEFPDENARRLFETVQVDWEDAPATYCIRTLNLYNTQIEVIKSEAFMDAYGIEKIYFPETLKVIEFNAFCSGNFMNDFTELNFAYTQLEEIQGAAFYGQPLLKTISLPSTLKSIGTECFKYCHNLKDIYVELPLQDFKKILLMSEYDPALPDCFDLGSYEKLTIHCTDGSWKLNQIWQGTPDNIYTSRWFKKVKDPRDLAHRPDDEELIPF